MKIILRFIALTILCSCITAPVLAQAVTIPVVFHVLYGTTPQNVHDTILQEQIDVMNEDLTANNADLWKVPAVWQPIIGSMQTTFVLASLDPAGNPTTGVERRQHVGNWQNNNMMKSYATGGLDAWPDTSYLNIWVCSMANSLLGYTQLPGGPAATDGIVLHYAVVGRGQPAQAPFNAGRIGTHEFGHWLGLAHIGPDNSCADIDSCADTPGFTSMVVGSYSVGTILTDACQPVAPGIMWMNFMMYTDDTSMVFFTQDQVGRMTWTLNNMRLGLFTPDGIVTGVNQIEKPSQLSVFPSPSASGTFTLTRMDGSSRAEVQLYDVNGQLIDETIEFPAGSTTLQINLSAFADGVYSVVVRSEFAVQTKAVVVAR